MTRRSKVKRKGPFEKALRDAEQRGIHVLPPGEREPTPLETDSAKLKRKYGSVDALPLEFARQALCELRLPETQENLWLTLAFLKDKIDYYCDAHVKKYRRLRLLRSKFELKIYLNFYNALFLYVPDLPRPGDNKVIYLIVPKTKNDK